MFSGALADSQKRKAENDDGPRKRGGDNGPPSGPRAIPGEGRSLADRLGGRSRGPMQVRGQGNARGGMNGMGFGGNGSRGECLCRLLSATTLIKLQEATARAGSRRRA